MNGEDAANRVPGEGAGDRSGGSGDLAGEDLVVRAGEGAVEEVLPAALDGERLDRVVALVAGVSRGRAARLVGEGAVRLDGSVAESGSRRVAEGQSLALRIPEPDDPSPVPDPSVAVDVVFEDDQVAVVNKPAGLVVHPGSGPASAGSAPTLVGGLLARYPEMAGVGDPSRPGIVHRLDRDTSGLLVAARTPGAYESLVAQLKAHEPERVYTALVWGRPAADAGVIDAPIGRSLRRRTRMTVTSGGRRAVTRYEVDRRFDRPRPTALVTCRLETGRTHQIRVHLRSIGHPVVGDRAYDGGRPGLDPGRPFLHARQLQFRHPTKGHPVQAEAPLPPDLTPTLSLCS